MCRAYFLILAICAFYQLNAENRYDSLKSKLKTELQVEIKINTLIELGKEEYKISNFSKSKEYHKEAYELSLGIGDTNSMLRSKLNISQILKVKGFLDSALTNYFEIIKLSRLTRNKDIEAQGYYNIATIYVKLENSQKATEYILKSLKMYKELKNDFRIGNCKVIKAIIERHEKKYTLAINTLVEASTHYKKINDELGLSYCNGNLANIYENLKQYNEALKYYLKSYEFKKRVNDRLGIAIVAGNISGAYFNLDKDIQALKYMDTSMILAKEIGSKETQVINYERLIGYYKTIDNSLKVVEMYDKYIVLKTEMLKEESQRNTIALEEKFIAEREVIDAKVKIQLLEKENNLKALRLALLIIVIILIIFFSVLIFLKQKKIIKTKRIIFENERKLLESKNQIAKQELEKVNLESKNLANELQYKKQELLTFSAHLNSLKELEDNLKMEINKLKPLDTNKKTIEKIRGMLKSNNQNEENLAQLYSRIESISESFYFKMREKNKKLTEEDLRLASLVLLNLSSKEISEILFITPKSVDMKRYRLRKKLSLDNNVDLNVFLKSI